MVLLKNSTRDFWNSPPFERSTCFYVTITGNFENFQYFNSEKKIRPFKKNGVLPVTTLFLRKICFSLRALFKEFIWCTNHSHVHIYTFRNHWSFIWGCFLRTLRSQLFYNFLASPLKMIKKLFISPWKLFSFSRYLNVYLGFLVM